VAVLVVVTDDDDDDADGDDDAYLFVLEEQQTTREGATDDGSLCEIIIIREGVNEHLGHRCSVLEAPHALHVSHSFSGNFAAGVDAGFHYDEGLTGEHTVGVE
jgi:hypothetical protein